MGDPMQGMPPQGGGDMSGVEQAMKDTRSIYNPTDAVAMKQDGTISPDMPIKDFFATFGIDVDTDPLSKLIEFQKQQIGNADPLNKMKAIAGAGQQGQPTPPASGPSGAPVGRPPEVSAAQGGLGGLKTRLGGQ